MSHHSTHSASWRIAFSGVMTAMNVVLLFCGSSIPGAFYLAPAAASILVALAGRECGPTWGLLTYLASGCLSLMLVSSRRSVLLFLILIGYYPLVKSRIDRLSRRILRVTLKLTLCNVTMYGFFRNLLGLMLAGEFFSDLFRRGWIAILCFLLFGDAMFLLYDHGLTRILKLYAERIAPFLHPAEHRNRKP